MWSSVRMVILVSVLRLRVQSLHNFAFFYFPEVYGGAPDGRVHHLGVCEIGRLGQSELDLGSRIAGAFVRRGFCLHFVLRDLF